MYRDLEFAIVAALFMVIEAFLGEWFWAVWFATIGAIHTTRHQQWKNPSTNRRT